MVQITKSNLPRTPPKDKVPALYRSAVRILDDLDDKARAAAVATPHQRPEALKALRGARDTFAVWTTVKHEHTVAYFQHMDQWANFFMAGDGRLARIIGDAERQVVRAFTAAAVLLGTHIPSESETWFDGPRINVYGPLKCQFYPPDIAAAKVVAETCRAYINSPDNWYKTGDFAWYETSEQIYQTAVGRSDDMLARRFGCNKSLIRQRRKRGWDCIENSLAYLGIIEPPAKVKAQK